MPVLTATSGTTITAGKYLLQLKGCEIADGTNYRTKEPEEQLKWIWLIERVMEVDPSPAQQHHLGEEYWEWTGLACTPKSKAGERVRAILKRSLEVGEEIDTDILIGQRIKANFEAYTRQDGQPGTKIGSCEPYHGTGGVQAATPPPAAPWPPRDGSPVGPPPPFQSSVAKPSAPPQNAPEPSGADARPSKGQRDALAAAFIRATKSIVPPATEPAWTRESVQQMTRDLTGKEGSADLTAGETALVIDILEGRQPFRFSATGTYVLAELAAVAAGGDPFDGVLGEDEAF